MVCTFFEAVRRQHSRLAEIETGGSNGTLMQRGR